MSPTVSSECEKNKSDNFFFSFFFRSPLGYVRKRHAYRTQLVEPVPAQVSDLKISHGKLVKKIRGARGVYARYCPYITHHEPHDYAGVSQRSMHVAGL